MAKLLNGAMKKVSRADHHIRNLVIEIEKFKKKNPFNKFVEFGPIFQEWTHKIKLTSQIPNNITDTTWDAVNNLRAALDHIVYIIAVASRLPHLEHISFPFSDTCENFKRVVESNCKGIPSEIIDIIASFKPYRQDGNRILWALHKSCNINKHRIVVPIVIGSDSLFVKNLKVVKPEVSIPSPRWDQNRGELVYLKTSPDAICSYEISADIGIVFGEVEIIEGQSVLPVLRKMREIVVQIIDAVEDSAVKSGLKS